MYSGFVIGDRALGQSGDAHPHWNAAYGIADEYWVIAASAIGQSHLAHSLSRDDAVVIRRAGPWLAVAVADGVGSCPLSRFGAAWASDRLSSLLLRPFVPSVTTPAASPNKLDRRDNWEAQTLAVPRELSRVLRSEGRLSPAGTVGWWTVPDDMAGVAPAPAGGDEPSQGQNGSDAAPVPEQSMRVAFEETHASIKSFATLLGVEARELSCTALALLLNTETGQGVLARVGDGAFLLLAEEGDVLTLLENEESEDLQRTYAITGSRWADHYECESVNAARTPFQALYVMTDGVANDLLYSPRDSMRVWAQTAHDKLQEQESVADAATLLLHQLATYTVQGSYDDRTLVTILRRPQTHANSEDSAGEPQSPSSDSDTGQSRQFGSRGQRLSDARVRGQDLQADQAGHGAAPEEGDAARPEPGAG